MEIKIGQTELHEWTITNESGAVNLTGSTARLTIIDKSGAVIYTQSKTSFDNPTSGIVLFTIPRDDTADFTKGKIKAQLDILNTSDEKDYSEIYIGQIIDTLAV